MEKRIIETKNNDYSTLDNELAELIAKSTSRMPLLVEQIREYQQYSSTINVIVTEIAVKEDISNG